MRVSAIVMMSSILAVATLAVPACADPKKPRVKVQDIKIVKTHDSSSPKKHIGNVKYEDTKIIKADKAATSVPLKEKGPREREN